MSDTPIYDQLAWEYSMRNFKADMREVGRRMQVMIDNFRAGMNYAVRVLHAGLGVQRARQFGRYYAVIDEVAETYQAFPETTRKLAASMGISNAEAQRMLNALAGPVTHYTVHTDGRIEQHVGITEAKRVQRILAGMGHYHESCRGAVDFIKEIATLNARMANRASSLVPPPRVLPMHGIRKPQTQSLARAQLNRGRR